MKKDKSGTERSSDQAGRNDPCPCGSGKKHKKCCLSKEEAVNLKNYRYDKHLEIRHSAVKKVFDIGIHDLGLEVEDTIYYLFDFLSFDPGRDDKIRNKEAFDQFLTASSMVFFTHAYPIHELSILENEEVKELQEYDYGFDFSQTSDVNENYLWKYCLIHHPDQFSDQEKRFLASFEQGTAGYFKVHAVIVPPHEGQGAQEDYPFLEVQDLFTKKTYRIFDKSICEQVVKHDIVSGVLIPYLEDGERSHQDLPCHILEGSPPVLYPARDEGFIKELAKEYCQALRKKYPFLFEKRIDYSKVLKVFPMILYLTAVHYFHTMISMPLPKMVNFDQEEMILSSSVFHIRDRDIVKSLLIKTKGIRIMEETKKEAFFHWYNEKETILGTVLLKDKTLRLDTNSIERLERFKKMVNQFPMDFKKTDYTYAEEILEQASGKKPKRAEEELDLSEEEVERLARSWWEDYYNDWPVTKIPALGNMTPLEAVKSKEGRKKVKALIDEYENHYLRDSLRQDQGKGINIQKYFDPQALRKRLGLS